MPTKIDNEGGAPLLAWGADGIEPNTIEQSRRVARLPFVHSHLALMPDAHVGYGSTVGTVIATQGAIVPSAVGSDIGCFRGDTRVPLLNGTQRTLSDLAAEGGSVWVYSLDGAGQIVPGHAVAKLTRHNAEMMKVTVSGGDEIVCTPDHLFMLNDGTYREARHLRFNDSLMPLYRKWQTRDGYESASTGKPGSRRLTHIRIFEATNGAVPAGHLVHHKDHNHFNNDPANLEAVEVGEHSRHHATKRGLPNGSAEFQEKRHAGIRRRKEDPTKRAQMAEVGTRNITAYMAEHPEHYREMTAGNGRRGAPFLARFNRSPRVCDECGQVTKNPAALRWHKQRAHASNDKVIAIDMLRERADVFCLQVEEHHNFALAAGVFVHNCGMVAARTTMVASQLPDNLGRLHGLIREAVPAGVGQGHEKRPWVGRDADDRLYRWAERPSQPEMVQNSNRLWNRATSQHGTLGAGNHFVEVCVDEDERVWVVLHSGSRGVGKEIAQRHIDKAKALAKKWFIPLEDPELAYLVQGTDQFEEYIHDMLWAQEYARTNRETMIGAILAGFAAEAEQGRLPQFTVDSLVNAHHNYTEQEHHHGKNLWVTRKGAVRARVGDLSILPGSMATGTYIVEGKGNEASFCSAAHGAGRKMSRGVARRTITEAELRAQMDGIVWNDREARDLLDEAPDAYKDVRDVMEAQADLVRVVHVLRQVLNFKGTR